MTAALFTLLLAAAPDAGVRPVGANGKPLNLDFETGTLADWTADGKAFTGQPIKGDAVKARRGDMTSNHQGEYWIGGYERAGDKATGTLTSVPFKVTHPWASFLVGGGPWPETCVEVVLAGTNEVVFRASGQEDEGMIRVAVDLTKHADQEIRVRVVDRHTGHWGHVNFDDFRFHTIQPPKAQGRQSLGAVADDYKFAGQPPKDAAKNMTVPPGFSVSLFAGEPDLHQPIAMCTDDRGRLWVVEAFVYPKRKPHAGPLLPEADRKLGDKILIFEDTDGDGVHDKKTTFIEGLNLASGIELGFGGVWVGAAPYLMFIPDANRDDMPDGPPQILLDGWGYQDTHETLNSFVWGPDGWLYGCHGVFTHSRVGKPGTPDAARVPINAGVWRYHPTKHTFEVFAHGTSNPWGLDYNAHGDFFVEACVIPHLWHIVQGGRYQRQGGQHFNPHTYDDIKTIAKHRHFVGNQWNVGDRSKSSDLGGGHAHSGLMCYQGGVWPKEYHGKLFMGNIHGHRINVDEVKPKGSGYEGDRNSDFLLSHDKHCIIVAIHAGPDGNVYFCDWSDKQVCHRNEVEIWDRTNGRVFKVSHKDAKPVKGLDLQKCTNGELMRYQSHANQWYVRHARRILQERAALAPAVVAGIRAGATHIAATGNPQDAMHALWILHVTGGAEGGELRNKYEHVRAWAVQFVLEDARDTKTWQEKIAEMGAEDPSPVVRRVIAGGLQRLPVEDRWSIHRNLIRHAADAGDHNLLFMYWYAGEPFADVDPKRAMHEANHTAHPQYLQFMARRVASAGTSVSLDAVVARLGRAGNDEKTMAILRGLTEGLVGRRPNSPPTEWADAYAELGKSANAEVRNLARAVAVAFRDPAAISQMIDIAADAKADAADRRAALAAVLDAGHNRTGGLLKHLLKDAAMRADAIRGCGRWADDGIPAELLGIYAALPPVEKRDAVYALASRATYAVALLDAVAAKKVPAADIPAETIRQLRNLGVAALDKQIADVWGVVRDTPAARKTLIAGWAKKLTAPYSGPVDLSHGRAVYARVCQQCHTMYAVGGKVGPDITGSNRANLDYLLENMFDPSAVIPKEYAATKLNLADGRVVTGIVKEETAAAIVVATATETLTIPVADVEKRTPSLESMMPDDLTKQATDADIRALVAYLRAPQQVPILATAENAKDFFNGKDLAGWSGDPMLWRVENGEIVGRTKGGLKRNAFLVSQMTAADFKLTLSVKLTPNAENSGVQFRSEPLPDGEMRGPQADAGAGWWGKLYEESGRGLLWKESGEAHVKPGEWNEYVVEAVGPRVRTWINGKLCVDLTDEKLARRGVVGLQMHSGGPLEVRFKG